MNHIHNTLLFLLICGAIASMYGFHGTKERLSQLESDNAALHELIATDVEQRTHIVTMTAYTPTVGETDSTPDQTATLEKAVPGGTCAVSRDLVPFLMGRTVYIPGHGVWRVNDVMNTKIENTLDLCVNSHKTAVAFGKKQDMVVVIIK